MCDMKQVPPTEATEKTAPAAEPVNSLGVLMAMVRSELARALETEFAAQNLDLSFMQYLILKKAKQLGAVSATELARAVELDGGAMTRQLDQLERKGYLRRAPHALDRRALRIELTEAGARMWKDTAFICGDRVMTAAQSSLSATERLQLNDYLERVLRTLRDRT